MKIRDKRFKITTINFNAGEQTATVYTRDKGVMRKLDALVIVSRES